ncbi:MAG: MFS transporter [Candidatus Eisenbacteria bacterium]
MSSTPSPADAFPRWRVFPAIGLGVIMATLDISVVNIALPTLQRSLRAPFTTVEWVVLAYVITITGLLLSAGRLADLHGRRRVYAAGLVVFTAASALCGMAPSVGMLIAARVVQGVGAALVSANGSALLVNAFPLQERGRALGAFGALVGVGLAIGPVIGGLVVQALSWRWIFFVNLPLGLLTLWLLFARVPNEPSARDAHAIDTPAALIWSAALVSLMLAVSRGPVLGWRHPAIAALFALAVALLALFAWTERRSAHPMLPLALLFSPLGLAVSLTFLGQMLSIAVGFHLPLYFEDVLGFSAAKSGGWLAALPLAALVTAPFAGRMADAFGTKPLTMIGMALTAAGFWVLSGVGVAPHPVHLIGGMLMIGAGQGLFAVPNASALLSLVPREQLGIASGLQGTARNLGIATGSAMMGAIVASRYHAHGGGILASTTLGGVDAPAFAGATHDAYVAMAILAVMAAGVAWRQRPTQQPAQP